MQFVFEKSDKIIVEEEERATSSTLTSTAKVTKNIILIKKETL